MCQCNQTLPINTRSSPFVPFHRRPRVTTPTNSESSLIRTKTDPIKSENVSETIEQHDNLAESTATTVVTTNTQPATNEKSNDWIASTPNSVGVTGPPSVLAPITNLSSTTTNSPVSNPAPTRGVKRSAAKAFDEAYIEDDELEQHKQTYDFHPTDSL